MFVLQQIEPVYSPQHLALTRQSNSYPLLQAAHSASSILGRQARLYLLSKQVSLT